MALSIYRRASAIIRHLEMLEDSRFVVSSVIWSLITTTNISLPEHLANPMGRHDPAEMAQHVRPQAIELRKAMKIRMSALFGLLFVYTSVLINELGYR